MHGATIEDYISFDLPPEIDVSKMSAEEVDQVLITGGQQASLMKAVRDIYSTPEGKDVIEKAAESSLDGKIHMINNPGGLTLALGGGVVSNTIIWGDRDADVQYLSPENGNYYDITIQRALFHELYHLGNGHSMNKDAFNFKQEEEAIVATNNFMRKYYGEPDRTTDYSQGRTGGTPGWDINENFKIPSPGP